MEYLSIGQMASLNLVSEQAIRLYQRKGLLEPAYVNKESGYRYYTLDQCSVLDFIQQMRSVGMSLEEIGMLMDSHDPALLEQRAQDAMGRIEQTLRDATVALSVAKDILVTCRQHSAVIPFEEVQIESLPERRAFVFPITPQPPAAGAVYSDCWERIRKEIRLTMLKRGYPSAVYRRLGRMVSKEQLESGEIAYTAAHVFVDESIAALFPDAKVIPGGSHLVMYSQHCFDTECTTDLEACMIGQLLEYAEKRGLEPAGDYYDETLEDTPPFRYQGRDALFKLCLPVRRCEESL